MFKQRTYSDFLDKIKSIIIFIVLTMHERNKIQQKIKCWFFILIALDIVHVFLQEVPYISFL